MNWVTLLECTCLFGLYSFVGRDWQKEMGTVTLPKAFVGKWCQVRRCVSVGATPGSISFTTEVITVAEAFPWSLEAGSCNKHQRSTQGHLLWAFVVLDIAGDQPLAEPQKVQF